MKKKFIILFCLTFLILNIQARLEDAPFMINPHTITEDLLAFDVYTSAELGIGLGDNNGTLDVLLDYDYFSTWGNFDAAPLDNFSNFNSGVDNNPVATVAYVGDGSDPKYQWRTVAALSSWLYSTESPYEGAACAGLWLQGSIQWYGMMAHIHPHIRGTLTLEVQMYQNGSFGANGVRICFCDIDDNVGTNDYIHRFNFSSADQFGYSNNDGAFNWGPLGLKYNWTAGWTKATFVINHENKTATFIDPLRGTTQISYPTDRPIRAIKILLNGPDATRWFVMDNFIVSNHVADGGPITLDAGNKLLVSGGEVAEEDRYFGNLDSYLLNFMTNGTTAISIAPNKVDIFNNLDISDNLSIDKDIAADGNGYVGGYLLVAQTLETALGLTISETITPPSAQGGKGKIYVKSSDNDLYFKDGSGVEYKLNSSITSPQPGYGEILTWDGSDYEYAKWSRTRSGTTEISATGIATITGIVSDSFSGWVHISICNGTSYWGGIYNVTYISSAYNGIILDRAQSAGTHQPTVTGAGVTTTGGIDIGISIPAGGGTYKVHGVAIGVDMY